MNPNRDKNPYIAKIEISIANSLKGDEQECKVQDLNDLNDN